MPYIIDGHNLIPKIGLSLRSFEDENELIKLLQEFCRLKRAKVEVYFDGAPPGQSGTRKLGSVTAHFVRDRSSADDAIRARLQKLARDAQNWIVVSSDQQVQSDSRAVRARVLDSAVFAQQVWEQINAGARKRGAVPPENDVDQWLKEFGEK
jgi:hypothetical protein